MQLGTETQQLYAEKAPELLESIVPDEDMGYSMRRDAKTGYCVRFSDGLCGIQAKYGEDFLGDACHFYPRATRAMGADILMTGTLSCPEIARLALFGDKAFEASQGFIASVPKNLKDYLPGTLTKEQAQILHQQFMEAAFDGSVTPEHIIMRIRVVAESLERIAVTSWLDAVPFYMAHADAGLPPPQARATDPAFLLQSLCGLAFGGKKVTNSPRLMQTIGEMEQALHIRIRMDTLEIVPLPDSIHATASLLAGWQEEWRIGYEPVMRRYLAMQLSLAIFPFGGFGSSLTSRITIIGIRFAYIILGLMSACHLSAGKMSEADIIRVIQSLSRFLDHLGNPEFSLKIYQEAGWLDKARLRGLLQC